MTEGEWLNCTDPRAMLEFLRGKASNRKVRLFACGRCRLFNDQISLAPVVVAERYADGEADDEERQSAFDAAEQRMRTAIAERDHGRAVREADARDCNRGSVNPLFELARYDADTPPEWAICLLFRDLFGNPFRPAAVDRAWLTTTAVSLARQMYESRDFSPMPILADALQDAGCDNTDILNHCRSEASHVRGCWVVDLLLGKE